MANVYETADVDKLALWAVKYKARDGWSQADALRKAHPKTDDAARNAVLKFMVDGVLPKVDSPPCVSSKATSRRRKRRPTPQPPR
ncbi:hypothetical protein ACXXDK_05645 [Deinococcus sp. PESE-38]